MREPALLDIAHLSVRFGESTVVDDVSLSLHQGEKLAIVGESGSGKSITALSILRLIDTASTTGSIRFERNELCQYSDDQMLGIRGAQIGMIFQEPMTALNPLYTVGLQISEVLAILHEVGLSEKMACLCLIATHTSSRAVSAAHCHCSSRGA